MVSSVPIDLGRVAHDLHLPIDKIRRTVELLDDGNTVPFITRYRKDHTGGLDEEQIRAIQFTVGKLRALAERKQTILKSIESQGKLTPELAQQINQAPTTKQLEDLYLPYKPKKQSLATQARERGLEPLAREIIDADPKALDLNSRAADFINPDKGVKSLADVMLGVGHLIAERYSERADLRGRLRKIMRSTGQLVSSRVESAAEPETESESNRGEDASEDSTDRSAIEAATSDLAASSQPDNSETAEPPITGKTDLAAEESPVADSATAPAESSDSESTPAESDLQIEVTLADGGAEVEAPAADGDRAAPSAEMPPAELESPDAKPDEATKVAKAPKVSKREKQAQARKASKAAARHAKKEKKRQKLEASFKDYFDFREPIAKIPPHRVLAINRGERIKILRVRIEADAEQMFSVASELLIPANHPHADFLRGCLRDALLRLIVPSLEREARRELTEDAETHAVDVFARNLRKLLLQPPVRSRRVLAMDPGFRSGVKIVSLTEFGNVLAHDLIHVIGAEERVAESRQKLADFIRKDDIHVIAIGNGTACRETELFVADVIAKELADRDVAYLIVNEAGASVYSTSELGREELPDFDATQRGAISIGRRVQDPLSELVKITPANIGVGLYQHDVKAKHLQESLDAVVESCVNYVGVDVNSASPALLGYVSGLNQLTARRVYQYRRENGPFRSRDELKNVPGVGEATFVQAAGFLKITGCDNPLDATWIHPESYDIARRVLERLGSGVEELAPRIPARPLRAAEPAPTQAAISDEPAETGEPSTPPDSDHSPAVSKTDSIVEEQPKTAEPIARNLPGFDEPIEAATAPAADEPSASSIATEAPPASVAQEKPSLAQRAASVDLDQLVSELNVGKLLLQDIVGALLRPGRDPREDFPPPIFRREVMKLEDLEPGMELTGTVLNVVDFGAFVDIGLSESGLVHISRLADRFIRDPHEVVGVGDVLKVWVMEIDKQRRRVSLTAIAPGSERPRQSHGRQERPSGERPHDRPKKKRPPRDQQRRTDGPAPHGKRPPRQSAPPKPAKPRPPAKPITPEMAEGKEPMRTFSDLLQFYEKKRDDGAKPPPKS